MLCRESHHAWARGPSAPQRVINDLRVHGSGVDAPDRFAVHPSAPEVWGGGTGWMRKEERVVVLRFVVHVRIDVTVDVAVAVRWWWW